MKKLKFIFSLIGTMIFSGCSFDDEIKALKTLKKLDDGLYFIEYIGDYDFDAFLAQGGNKTNEEKAQTLSATIAIIYENWCSYLWWWLRDDSDNRK